ncbi:hypothetical protein CMEL01_14798 [Colletotrichum melonis]|uniref:Uncharacterized protein n=1 Tax=Colletotrichum melonis TaxID=1209925 RepID=A0AAI9UMC3_9PEZI|nr:hypothetical protein CMEL01_14798 [Colletotrichum melonis]
MLLGCPCASAMSGALRGKCFSQNVSPMAIIRAPCKVRFDWGKSRHRYGHLAAQVLPQREQTKRESDSNNTTRTERIHRVARAVGNNSHWMGRRWITRVILLDNVSDALITAAYISFQRRRSICIAGFLLPFFFSFFFFFFKFTFSVIHLNPYSSLQKWGPETGAGRRPLGWDFGLGTLAPASRRSTAPPASTAPVFWERTETTGKEQVGWSMEYVSMYILRRGDDDATGWGMIQQEGLKEMEWFTGTIFLPKRREGNTTDQPAGGIVGRTQGCHRKKEKRKEGRRGSYGRKEQGVPPPT